MNYIYVLIDPESQEIRYVGKTNNPKKRMDQHLWDASTHRKSCYNHKWICKLLNSGMKPEMKIIEECESEWEERERYWIKYYREIGARLTNVTNGGEGFDIPYRGKEWYKKVIDTRKKRGNIRPSKESVKKMQSSLLERNSKFCKNGHLRTENNTEFQIRDGKIHRNCLECAKIVFDKKSRKSEQELLESRKRNYATLQKWHEENGFPPKEKCIRGHDLSGNNLRILARTRKDGSVKIERICRECVRIRNKECKRRRRERNAQGDSSSKG